MKLDDISQKVRKFSQDTVKEVQKMNEVRQLNAGVSAEKKKISAKYMEIGKKLYDLYKEEPLQDFESEISAIHEAFLRIDALQEQIRTVKGVTLCPNCNMEVSVNDAFCSNCGSKMPETYTIEDGEQKPEPPKEKEQAYETAEEGDYRPAEAAEADKSEPETAEKAEEPEAEAETAEKADKAETESETAEKTEEPEAEPETAEKADKAETE